MPPITKWKTMPCIELACVIGSLEDGCVTKNEYSYQNIIQLNVIDKEFGETFSRATSKFLNKKYMEPCWNEKEKRWYIEYGSKAFYTWYKKCEEQGLEEFKLCIEYNKETVRYYLRGLYDSEGYNNGNKQIFLSNIKEELLKYAKYLFNTLKCVESLNMVSLLTV